MKLKDLHERLGRLLDAGMSPDTDIILSIDPEGNGYHNMNGIDSGYWEPGHASEGYISDEWSASDAGYSSDEELEERLQEMQPCLCLWP